MSDIGDWFKNIPFITRYWFAGSIAVPLIGKLGLIGPMYLVLWPEAFFHKFQLLMIPLIMSVLYVWAQLNRDMIVSFWFGTRFKACYLPWVILGFNYIIGGSVVNELIGNLVGHLYFFLMFKYPMDLGGRSFLSTPQFLYRMFPNRRGGVSGFGVPPSRRPVPQEQAGGGVASLE
ncbi:Derlin-1 [Labeo rohita]|uniref:Derlin n=1 Tax=Labeo rohita TaxID=84645 RepID=A0A498LTV6_LABRO|nr:Derlin-1 [Labeo rohita]